MIDQWRLRSNAESLRSRGFRLSGSKPSIFGQGKSIERSPDEVVNFLERGLPLTAQGGFYQNGKFEPSISHPVKSVDDFLALTLLHHGSQGLTSDQAPLLAHQLVVAMNAGFSLSSPQAYAAYLALREGGSVDLRYKGHKVVDLQGPDLGPTLKSTQLADSCSALDSAFAKASESPASALLDFLAAYPSGDTALAQFLSDPKGELKEKHPNFLRTAESLVQHFLDSSSNAQVGHGALIKVLNEMAERPQKLTFGEYAQITFHIHHTYPDATPGGPDWVKLFSAECRTRELLSIQSPGSPSKGQSVSKASPSGQNSSPPPGTAIGQASSQSPTDPKMGPGSAQRPSIPTRASGPTTPSSTLSTQEPQGQETASEFASRFMAHNRQSDKMVDDLLHSRGASGRPYSGAPSTAFKGEETQMAALESLCTTMRKWSQVFGLHNEDVLLWEALEAIEKDTTPLSFPAKVAIARDFSRGLPTEPGWKGEFYRACQRRQEEFSVIEAPPTGGPGNQRAHRLLSEISALDDKPPYEYLLSKAGNPTEWALGKVAKDRNWDLHKAITAMAAETSSLGFDDLVNLAIETDDKKGAVGSPYWRSQFAQKCKSLDGRVLAEKPSLQSTPTSQTFHSGPSVASSNSANFASQTLAAIQATPGSQLPTLDPSMQQLARASESWARDPGVRRKYVSDVLRVIAGMNTQLTFPQLSEIAANVSTTIDGTFASPGGKKWTQHFLAECSRQEPQSPQAVSPSNPAFHQAGPSFPRWGGTLSTASKAQAVPPPPSQTDELTRFLKSAVKSHRADWIKSFESQLAEAVAQKSVPNQEQLFQLVLDKSWPSLEQHLQQGLSQNLALSGLHQDVRERIMEKQNWRGALEEIDYPLTFGETFPESLPITHKFAGDTAEQRLIHERLIGGLLRFEYPATEEDAGLLCRALNALPTETLSDLAAAGYQISVTRNNLSQADQDLRGKILVNGELADLQDGVHLHELDKAPHIVVSTRWRDGKLELPPENLFRQIGKAYDQVLGATEDKDGKLEPLHVTPAISEAFKSEHARLPKRFHEQREFVGEVYSRFLLDPERASREFPLTTKAFAASVLGQGKANTEDLTPSRPYAVVNLSSDAFTELEQIEAVNQVQSQQGKTILPYVLELQGDPHHNLESLASHLASHLRALRSPNQLPFSPEESLLKISPATFNDAPALEKLLTQEAQSGRGTLLYLDDLAQIPDTSAGFAVMKRFQEKLGGQTPLLLQGSDSELNRFRATLPTLVRRRFTSQPLTPTMMAEAVRRTAQSEGFQWSLEATQAFASRVKDGDLQQAHALWRAIKTSLTDRNIALATYLPRNPEAIGRVLVSDVQSAKLPKDQDPLEALNKLVGLEAAKRELKAVLGQLELQKQQEAHGLEAVRPRLNLLFEGNPGTGKTTVAKLFAESLSKVGYLKNKNVNEVRVQDLLQGRPEDNVKKLFESNRGGVIFVDEMHQLKDTSEGKRAFRAMIPYLGSAEYADTVFIGAGYRGEMRDLIRDVDDGAERRFSSVPFDDYNSEQLGQILDKMCADRQRVLSQESRDAALARLERERRKMKHFGNAGSVQSILEGAIKKQTSRLSAEINHLSKDQLVTLADEDFAAEKALTPDQVWAEINELQGLEDIKSKLRSLCDSIEYDKEVGQDPLNSFEPYFILDGPPGTGKTTMARLIVKLMSAYDIIPSHNLTELQGGSFQAQYVGQTGPKVEKAFESMWGQGGFIDEVSALAGPGAAFGEEAIKSMLAQMENNRGRFILVVADYAHKINQFLDIDPGLARRFGHRFSLEPLNPEQATAGFEKLLTKQGIQIAQSERGLLLTKMTELSQAPQWASSGDVRKVLNGVVALQKSLFIQARKSGQTLDPKVLMSEAVLQGFDKLIDEKWASAKGNQVRPKTATPQLQTEKAVAAADQSEQIHDLEMSTEDQRVLAALSEIDKKYASQVNDDPEALRRLENDVNSSYIRDVSEKLGTTPEDAVKKLISVRTKIKRMAVDQTLVERFSYHCPYCGGIDHPSCAYINHPLDWKIEHSLKKPWTEVVDVEREVEEVVEEKIPG